MAGLIPLLLQPAAAGSRTTVIFAPNPPEQQPVSRDSKPAQQQQEESRPAMSQPQEQAPASAPVLEPASVPAPKQRLSTRLSQAPLTPPTVPCTNNDWAKVVASVKRQYLARRYRPCSVRCSEILDNIKDPASVEPTYLIYLHFYAASSLEMSAKSLQSSSPYRTKLLHQARDHYTSASELIQIADESMTRLSRPSSSAATSSLHSPTGSYSSRGWTNSTELSSPTISIYSIEDIVLPKAQAPAKKRVTFDLSEQPIIRPDSPTLGFDDLSLHARPKSDPTPLASKKTPTSIMRYESPSRSSERESEPEAAFLDEDPFVVHRSVHRYCGLLTSLRRELTTHLAEVEAQLTDPSTAPTWSGRSSPDSGSSSEDLRTLELQTRIERLRQNGWQRPRFDPKRYEQLRENALAELA